MKRVISILGIAAGLYLLPGCKKDNTVPAGRAPQADTATLYVMINSLPCDSTMKQYTSASVDIRGIKVLTTAGWEELTPVPGAWDVVSLQTAPVPVAEITNNTKVQAGTISKIMLTFGTNNKLVVNNQAATCYKLGVTEVTLDVQGEIKADALNEIVLNIDICGKFTVQQRYQEDPCYTLTPTFTFKSMVQR
jgi:hypothetical protein